MNSIKEIMENNPIQQGTQQATTYRTKQPQRTRQTIYDCDLCNGTETIFLTNNSTKRCICSPIRSNLMRLQDKGTKNILDKYTFDNFVADEQWQIGMLNKCKAYITDNNARMLYIGGQMGSGKTHLCTATFIDMLLQGINGLRMEWRPESTKLKALANSPDYQIEIGKYKDTELLFIDDLFKTQQGTNPTSADINLAFEIIDHRYNRDKLTIISSEKYLDDIIAIDEAIGSRIKEMAQNYYINIAYDQSKNYRLNKPTEPNS